MARILVLTTGGTIGSQVSQGCIVPETRSGDRLLEQYRAAYPSDTEFLCREPFRMLSENASGETLRQLIAAVQAGLAEGMDGIILTHGTDTLVYSGAALAYALGNCTPPVVLVSSNYVLSDPRANGLINFHGAVQWIQAGDGHGVYVSYQNAGETVAIHRGSRLLQQAACDDAVHSLLGKQVAVWKGDSFWQDPVFPEAPDAIFPLDLPALEETAPVLWLAVHPGMVYPALPDTVRAVLLEGYHSGTLCTGGAPLQMFCKEAARRGIPVFLVGVTGEMAYESTRAFVKLQIRPLPPMAPAAAFMKLWMLLAAGRDLEEMCLPLGGDLQLF